MYDLLAEDTCERTCYKKIKTNKLLYLAIINGSPALFEAILKLAPEEDPDYNMMLRLSLCTNIGDELILKLIQKGGHPNSECLCSQKPSLLQIAISKSKLNVAKELIERGADINVRYILNMTPLHMAAAKGDVDAVRLLLSYGADVSLLNQLNETALECAIWHFSEDVVNVLKQFYSNTNLLLAASKVNNTLGIALSTECLNTEIDFNHVSDECLHNLILLTMLSETEKLFELFWSKVNHSRCFNVLLNCKEVVEYLQDKWFPCRYKLYLYTTRFLKLNHDKRLNWIYKYLNFGYKFNWKVIKCLYKEFGFNEELRAIIHYSGHPNDTNSDLYENLYLHFIFNLEEPSSHTILCMFNYLFVLGMSCDNNGEFWAYSNALRLFSLPIVIKKEHLQMLNSTNQQSEKYKTDWLRNAVTFPSLLELSRTKARAYIKQYYNVKTPCEFIEIMEILDLPPIIEDIIMLIVPVY